MYLITVARTQETGNEGPVPIASIAAELAVAVPSANEMIRKLDGRGLVVYEPYRGVRLTETGHRIADQVLRTRRLWATFLAEHLGFSPASADDQACHLEHATSPDAANRLATFLGNPAAGPLGRPIPAATKPDIPRIDVALVDLSVGATAEVVSIAASGQAAKFLTAEQVVVGCNISVTAVGSTGLLVEVAGKDLHLDFRVAETIDVRAVTARGKRGSR